MCIIRAYLGASTDKHDAARARDQIQAFAAERGVQIASWYVENDSGAKLLRPELFRLLADSHPGDVLLVEQVDRLSRLDTEGWERLKVEIKTRLVRVVALDLPTTWVMANGNLDDVTARMFAALTDMMLDMLAAVSRKDHEERRRRTMRGQAKARAEGKNVGRPENTKRNARIADMLAAGTSYTAIQEATGCGRATVAKIARRIRLSLPEAPGSADAAQVRTMRAHGDGPSEIAKALGIGRARGYQAVADT